MENRGIEPRLLGCRRSVLPLSLVPQCGCGGGNRTHLVAAYEPPCTPAHLLRMKGSPGSQDRTDGLSIIGRVLSQLSFSRWSPAPESNRLHRFTKPAHHQQCLPDLWNLEPAERIERSSDAYRAPALPLSYTGWSRRADSNRHLSVTRARFFLLNYFDMERVTGFEPVSGPWQGPILAARRYPPGASGERIGRGSMLTHRSKPCCRVPLCAHKEPRTLRASLDGWNSTNK